MIRWTALAAAVTCAVAACASAPAPPPVATTSARDEPRQPPEPGIGATRVTAGEIQYSFVALGRATHDGFTLPVTDPAGSHIAVQERSAADWPTILAALDSGAPEAGTIALHAIRDGRLVRTSGVGPDLLLGRMAVAGGASWGLPDGVLVESPRLDGSRWIGILPWDAGDGEASSAAVRWVASDARVHAFAAAGPSGWLAWSVRDRGEPRFSLAIRGPDGALRIAEPPDGASLVAPTFSSDGRHLFALRVGDGTLAAVAYPMPPPSNPAAMARWRPLAELPLSWRADEKTAYQSVVPLGASAQSSDGCLILFHPRFGRIATWSPASSAVSLASADSVAATDLGNGIFAVGSRARLAVEPAPQPGGATDARSGISVVEAAWVPRGPSLRDGRAVVIVRPGSREVECALVELRGADPAATQDAK